jgi:hypothetical protein
MGAKSLKLDSLDLDLENPRITLAADQRDAMQKILNEQKVKLINLAESVAIRGFSPMDRCLVLRSHLRTGKFIVLEGNRRVLCAKLLKNPSLIHSLTMTDAFRKRLLKASGRFNPKDVEPVDCYEVKDRAEGNDWIRQRHKGEDSGRGIVDWSAMASSRFAGRDPALQALEFVLDHAGLSDAQKEQINNAKFISTLDRLLSTPTVRTAIGFDITVGKLSTELPADEAIKPLRRIVLDLAEKEINVNDVKTKDQQNDYISKLKSADRADLSKKTGTSVAIDEIKAKDFKSKPTPAAKKAKTPKTPLRTTLVPKACKLNVTNPKIAGIFGELRTLQLSKHVHAIGVLLRCFVEMSVDEYLTTIAKLPLFTVNPANGQKKDKYLKTKMKEAIDHLVASGATEKEFKGVRMAMNDANNPFSIETLHAYIHDRFFTPIDTHLRTAWDNGQPLFEKIWP